MADQHATHDETRPPGLCPAELEDRYCPVIDRSHICQRRTGHPGAHECACGGTW